MHRPVRVKVQSKALFVFRTLPGNVGPTKCHPWLNLELNDKSIWDLNLLIRVGFHITEGGNVSLIA